MTDSVDKVEKVEVKADDFSDIFISETDTFDVSVKYYKKDGQVVVEGIDESFSATEPCKSVVMSFKYPDQSDASRIATTAKSSGLSDNMDIREILSLEFSRLLCLVRKWNVGKELSNQNIMNLHPKLVKAVIVQLRTKIAMDGIF